MRTVLLTVAIPEQLLKEAMRHAQATSGREAVVAALEDFNRRARLRALVDRSGKSDTFMSNEELMAMRIMDMPKDEDFAGEE